MKKMIFVVMISTLMLSCQKKWESLLEPAVNVETMNDLKVASSFNWKLSKELTIGGEYLKGSGIIRITSSDGKVVYYTGSADGRAVTLSVPVTCTDVMINGQSYSNMVMSKVIPLKSSGTFSYNPAAYFAQRWMMVQEAIALQNDKFLIFYSDASGSGYNTPYVVVGNIANNAITYGTPYQIGQAGAVFNRLIQHADNKFLAAYVLNPNSFKCSFTRFTVSGNAITGISTYASNDVCYSFEMDKLTETRIAFAWREPDNMLYTRILDLSGSGIVFGNKIAVTRIQSYNTTRFNLLAMNQSRYVIGPMVSYNDGRTYLTIVENPGNINQLMIRSSQPITNNPIGYQEVSDLLKLSETRMLVFHNQSNRTVVRLADFNGTSFNLSGETQLANSNLPLYHLSSCLVEPGLVHLAYTDPTTNYLTFNTLSLNGDQLTVNTPTPTSSRYRNYYYTEYSPYSNFMAGSNKVVCVFNESFTSRWGVAVLGTYTPAIVDADHDGVPDADDNYPNDPLRAFDNYFPAAGFGSLAYEDLWPGKGDYDFNDIVVDYRFHTVTNAQNMVVDITAKFVSKASGASLENGFGFQLSNASGDLNSGPTNFKFTTTGSRLFEDFIHLNAPGDEYGQHKPTIIVYDNFFRIMPNQGTGLGVNTVQDQVFVTFDTATIVLTPTQPTFSLADFALNSWNPFIIVNKVRGHEVHLPDFMPTDFADPDNFGKWEDDSQVAIGRSFKTVQNLPWAIDIPETFVWPKEKVDITQAYLKFAAWAQSSGTEYADWYKNLQGYRNEAMLYEVPEE